MKKLLLTLTVYGTVFAGVVYTSVEFGRRIEQAKPVNPYATRLPLPQEIQQALVDRGHDLVVDGVVGKQSQKAWDYEVCNDRARPYFVKGE